MKSYNCKNFYIWFPNYPKGIKKSNYIWFVSLEIFIKNLRKKITLVQKEFKKFKTCFLVSLRYCYSSVVAFLVQKADHVTTQWSKIYWLLNLLHNFYFYHTIKWAYTSFEMKKVSQFNNQLVLFWKSGSPFFRIFIKLNAFEIFIFIKQKKF